MGHFSNDPRTYRTIRRILVTFAAVTLAAGLTACGGQATPAPEPTVPLTAAPTGPSIAAPPTAAPPGSVDTETTDETPAVATTITAVDPADYLSGTGIVIWASPSGNIFCHIAEGEFSSGCQTENAPVPDGALNCTNPTFTIDQLTKGFFLAPNKVTPTCFNQGVFYGDLNQVLPYDHSITYNGFTCTSRMTGMMCDAGGGHGFVLSREQATWN